jgi:hypothetical protein
MTFPDSAPQTDHTEPAEIILEALAEGGSLTLLGIKAANGWRFRLVRDESTLADLLSEEDRQGIEFRSESEWVSSWQGALALLDKYRWHRLHALEVHPDFRQQIWTAVQARAARVAGQGDAWWVRWHLDRWQRVCHGEADGAA